MHQDVHEGTSVFCPQGVRGNADHPFRSFVNPRLSRTLSQLALDVTYVRGEGCYLYDAGGTRYLDFLSQYGALPFGFNHPRIWDAISAIRDRMEPSFVQPSILDAAGELARRLVNAAPEGLDRVTFANTGAEAVEAAIKLCRSATGRMKILAAGNGFHGKTLGALSATDKPAYQKVFGAPVPGFDYVPFGDADALREKLAERSYAAFIVEPIQGEGGIVEPPRGYLRSVQEICRETGTVFVLDEIQTGLGRTGRMFACEDEGVVPDVITVAKALGGGLVPIGAVVARAELVSDDFALKHTSTFAGNALSCRVGLATLDLLEENDQELVKAVAKHGAYLREGLLALKDQYRDIVAEVRGRGYILGLRFGIDRETWGSSLLGCLGETEFLTPLVVSHMLSVHRVRMGYTLNQGGVLRIEPPLTAGRAECDEFLNAMDATLACLSRRDTAQFTAHMTGAKSVQPVSRPTSSQPLRLRRSQGEGRFAFLFHPLTTRNYADADPTLQQLNDEQLGRLARCVSDNFDPFVIGDAVIQTPSGGKAFGEFIAVPRTAEELTQLPHRDAIGEIRMAAELARDRGAQIIGLGGYVSVVTRGGLYLKGTGLPAITTGNSYTSIAGMTAVERALASSGRTLADCVVSIVGATGSIGRAVALLMGQQPGKLILIGNPLHVSESERRLRKIAAETGLPPSRVVVTCNGPKWIPESDVVITATSAVGEIVRAHDLAHGAIVCDISRPPNVNRAISKRRPDVTIIDGGVVRLPHGSELSFSIDLTQHHVYACMADSMMLALEHRYEDTSLGLDLDLAQIRGLQQLARKHGFEVAAVPSATRTEYLNNSALACRAGAD